MPCQCNRIAIVLLTLSVFCACGRPPAYNASNANSQNLPFDRQSRSTEISPHQSLIPSITKLPEGTPIPIRLQTALSSASSHAGDTFSATVDEPVVIDGQTLVPLGTPATGRVLEAKPSARSRETFTDGSHGRPLDGVHEIGYLRIVLVSLQVGGKPVAIETSSIFAKGGWREERNPATGTASGATSSAASADTTKDRDRDRDVVFGLDRRLNFRLAQAVDLQ